MRVGLWWSVLGLLIVLGTQTARAGCKVVQIADLPVTMQGLKPLVSVNINGTPTHLIVDSGAFMSMLSPGKAAELQLKLKADNYHAELVGVGGKAKDLHMTFVDDFGLGGMTVHNARFIVGGNEYGYDVAGLLGQNLWESFDVEYDLANGHIRLMQPVDCEKQSLAYWAPQSGQAAAMIEILSAKVYGHTVGKAEVNGKKIFALFDTGANWSMLSLNAAARAGVKPSDPGVRSAGQAFGIGSGSSNSWIAPFASFKIGDEEIRNTHLRVADVSIGTDMLLGADFFLSHHIYVSNQQHRLYFTYNGGPVFNLSNLPVKETEASPAAGGTDAKPVSATSQTELDHSVPAAPAATADTGSGAPDTTGDALQRAASASQLGTALAARREFVQALAELDRACQLAPTESAYRVQRARVHLELKQADLALKDLDAALLLQPDDLDALLGRAEQRLDHSDKQGARTDLDTAVRTSTAQSDARFDIAMLYRRLDDLEPAAAQLDQWIAAHPNDVKRATAYVDRCAYRGLLGQDLPKALDNCNRALEVARRYPEAYIGRGLVQLRMGSYRSSIDDYDTALSLRPKIAWALYGRGLDRLHLGQTDRGHADIAAAVALTPEISTTGEKYGLVPPAATLASP